MKKLGAQHGVVIMDMFKSAIVSANTNLKKTVLIKKNIVSSIKPPH